MRGQLVGERRVIGGQVGHGGRQHQAVTVLVLQALAVQRGPPGGGAQQEAPAPHVTERPDGVARALEPEHGVEDVERDRRLAPGGIGRAGGGETGHGSRLVDALFQDLARAALPVRQLHGAVDRLVALARRGVDVDLGEQGVQAKGAGLVGNDRHHGAADGLVPQQAPHQTAERHGGRHRPAVGAAQQVGEDSRIGLAPAAGREPPGGERRRPAPHAGPSGTRLGRSHGRPVVGRQGALEYCIVDLILQMQGCRGG